VSISQATARRPTEWVVGRLENDPDDDREDGYPTSTPSENLDRAVASPGSGLRANYTAN
jgi:hypothetical protein